MTIVQLTNTPCILFEISLCYTYSRLLPCLFSEASLTSLRRWVTSLNLSLTSLGVSLSRYPLWGIVSFCGANLIAVIQVPHFLHNSPAKWLLPSPQIALVILAVGELDWIKLFCQCSQSSSVKTAFYSCNHCENPLISEHCCALNPHQCVSSSLTST